MLTTMTTSIPSDALALTTAPRVQRRVVARRTAEAMQMSTHVPGGFHGKTLMCEFSCGSASDSITAKPVM